MNDVFLDSNPVREIAQVTYDMWSKGWDEYNGGNISYLLDSQEVSLLKSNELIENRFMDVTGIPDEMVGKYILITASGSHFRTVKNCIKESMGVIKLLETGYQIVWGFEKGTLPTSEFYMHILSHNARLKVDKKQKVVVHNHATNATALSLIVEPNDSAFTLPLWRVLTESIVVFPDGVGVLPWQTPGTEKIGKATAKKLLDSRIVIWSYHGILATGTSIQDCFGLIETVDKAAGMYRNTLEHKNYDGLSDDQLRSVCEILNVNPREDIFVNSKK